MCPFVFMRRPAQRRYATEVARRSRGEQGKNSPTRSERIMTDTSLFVELCKMHKESRMQ